MRRAPPSIVIDAGAPLAGSTALDLDTDAEYVRPFFACRRDGSSPADCAARSAGPVERPTTATARRVRRAEWTQRVISDSLRSRQTSSELELGRARSVTPQSRRFMAVWAVS